MERVVGCVVCFVVLLDAASTRGNKTERVWRSLIIAFSRPSGLQGRLTARQCTPRRSTNRQPLAGKGGGLSTRSQGWSANETTQLQRSFFSCNSVKLNLGRDR